MLNSGRIYNLSNEDLVNNILAYYQFLDESTYQNKEQRKEFRALFYGYDFTNFWFWRSKKNLFLMQKPFLAIMIPLHTEN
ncbi:MAG: hypothetical protein ACJAZK_001562 [Psychroserpens sp.]|jgi:hypothetical protein